MSTFQRRAKYKPPGLHGHDEDRQHWASQHRRTLPDSCSCGAAAEAMIQKSTEIVFRSEGFEMKAIRHTGEPTRYR